MSVPVALILGAGSNIGSGVARAFAAKGYKIALVARKAEEDKSTANEVHIKGDFANPESLAQVFDKVRSKVGLPHVVVYNAALTTPNAKDNPLALPLDTFNRSLAINVTSVFAAAQHAALAFAELPASASRTFIYTGNCLNVKPILSLLDLGLGKSATAYIIRLASEAYKDKGYKFYYADERTANGSPVGNALNGEAHGELYAELAEGALQGPWQQTFAAGKGYQDFSGVTPSW